MSIGWAQRLSWASGVLAAAAVLLAGFIYDTRGNAVAAGALLLLAIWFASLWWRLRKWLRQVT